jgi:hypothetical protein
MADQDDTASHLPPPIQDQPIEADDSSRANDEGYQESSTSSLLSSIASDIKEGKIENGRMYANFGKHGTCWILLFEFIP